MISCRLTAAEWPEFRGPYGNGHASARDLPMEWNEGHNIRWRCETPGRGWSSPVIEGNRIWMTTAIEIEATGEERARLLKGNTGDQPLTVVSRIEMRALGVDRETGALVANQLLMVQEFPEPVHALNSFASPTPVIEAGKLYCHFGSYGTACLDTLAGKVDWTNQELRIKHENGPGSSPVIEGGHLIFHCDGSDEQFIVGLNKQTGAVAWKTPRSGKLNDNPQLKKSYGTPLLVPVADNRLLLSPGADWLYAYLPESGQEVWKLSYETLGFSISPRPVTAHGMLYLSTSFMQAEILAVKLDAKQPKIAWRYSRQAPQMSSPLLVGDHLYFVSEAGILSCLDARTGTALWTGRLGGNFSSSPIYADGRIYVANRSGSCFVLEPGTSFKLLATSKMDEAVMASPAAVDRAIYLRTDKALYRIES